MKILLIEDEEPIRETLKDLLEINGYTVLSAADGPAGLKLFAEGPDLILCDIGLPGMDGYQVLAALRELPGGPEASFIFLTAHAERKNQRRGMALGADDYITKPFTEHEIIDAIEARVRRQRPLRERLMELLRDQRREVGANWSHELLTPLTGVMGGLEIIESEADTIRPDELKEALGLIRASAERQEALSRKLILHYELERLKSTPTANRPSCPAQVVETTAVRTAALVKRQADLTVAVEHAHLPLAEPHLAAAVAEVVGNALRFTAAGQAVTLSGRRAAGRYRIEVTDTGAGLTPEQCASIGPFVQFGRNFRQQQGLGLGLVIAQSTAQVAGGKFHVEPGPGGRGLRAVFDLPLASA